MTSRNHRSLIEMKEAGKVIYKTEHNAVDRLPEAGDELLTGPSRNFQIFDPLEVRYDDAHHRLHRADRGQRCSERSAQRAGVSSTGVAPAFQTPLEPSPSLAADLSGPDSGRSHLDEPTRSGMLPPREKTEFL